VYRAVLAYLLQGLALAQRLAISKLSEPQEATDAILLEFDKCLGWMQARAADAPGNYGHLLKWLKAERAWALGDIVKAAMGFDDLLLEFELRQRPWHRAVATERAAIFHLTHGLAYTGRQLIHEALRAYELWGATGKVRQLRQQHTLSRTAHVYLSGAQAEAHTGYTTSMSADSVDMLAVLRTSQALSSETNLHRLKARVSELLGALTGAETVMLILRDEDGHSWFVSPRLGDGDEQVPVDAAAAQGLLPLSVFRYAARTRKPLLLQDAKQDDRFARDPYLANVPFSSLLAMPIMIQGEPHAMLILENRLTRGAFSADRLDALTLIAGQLAVSLDNASIYASLERKVAERTVALEEANKRLELLSVTDALTGLPNRRRFNEALAAEWLRARRAGSSVALAMIDIDHFKLFNDQYGHQGGDTCLRLVADTMRRGLRAGSDMVARYGGEEFVLLLPQTNLVGACVKAERVRAAVAALHEPHLKSTHGIVTVSMGVTAVVPPPNVSEDRLLALADAALYEAKGSWRNRVVSYEVKPGDLGGTE
jgi:diguanylate cyclase (GGDEF)-like protein